MKEITNADGGNENRKAGSFSERLVCDLFYDHTKSDTGDHRKNDRRDRAYPQVSHTDKNNITSDHDNIAMGKVKHLCDTVNHCVTKGYDSIDTAKAYSVDQVLYKFHKEHP